MQPATQHRLTRRQRLKLIACRHARTLSLREGAWRLVYRLKKHGCPVLFRTMPSPHLDASPRSFPGGWRGRVVAAYLEGEGVEP